MGMIKLPSLALLLLACISLKGAAAFTSITSSCRTRYPLYSAVDRGYETPINIEETAPRDTSTFEEWAYNYGIQRDPAFELAYNDNYDWSDIYAVTNADMATGQCALYVPEELILSSNKAMEELRSHDMDQAEKIVYSVNADSELKQYYLMVKILVEYEKGESSAWFPWLNS